MRLSKYFYKSKKDIKENLPLSLNRLLRGCFVSQEATGIVRFLPLGLKVLKKITKIIEEEMDKIALQIELPFLQSSELWKKSGRYEAYGKEMLRVKDRNNQEFLLPPTCEEAFFDVFKNTCESYRYLPKTLYQISWKFRDEMRPRSGLLRGRLFLMKDAYSFTETPEESYQDYVNHFNTYVNICKKLHLEVYSIAADSGEIGGDLSHEFVVRSEEGDGMAYLLEPAPTITCIQELKDISGTFDGTDTTKIYQEHRVMEIGHIFYYDTKYSEKTATRFTNQKGELVAPYGGCYGIGVTRLMGILSMEDFWPSVVAPFTLHMINIIKYEDTSENLYNILLKQKIDVLYDDRNLSFSEKKHDMHLIGIPYRIIVGAKIEFYYYKEEKFFTCIDEFLIFLKLQLTSI